MDHTSAVTSVEGGNIEGPKHGALLSFLSPHHPAKTSTLTESIPPGHLTADAWNPRPGERVLERDGLAPSVPVKPPKVKHKRYCSTTDCVAAAMEAAGVPAGLVTTLPHRVLHSEQVFENFGFKPIIPGQQ